MSTRRWSFTNTVMSFAFSHPYTINPLYKKRVAYFCMEYAIHQSLKTYAGGLGFLAGSHLKSAYELRQNMVGIGILWKFGYYEQVRKADETMDVLFEEKIYGFLKKTDIQFTIRVSGHVVFVTAYYLPPEIFQTPPLFFLSTDLPENDYLARTICHKLYDSNPEARIAAGILLGDGGATLLEKLNWLPDIYHLNESHALPLAFHLFEKYKSVDELKSKLRFTNHTPEPAGNQKTEISLLEKMGFFCNNSLTESRNISSIENNNLDHTLTALRLSGISNSVSKKHYQTLIKIWDGDNTRNLISITNAQSYSYWADKEMYQALKEENDEALIKRKKVCKRLLFEEVADQNGEIYDESVLTIVFAKRFGGYKRPGLLLQNMDRFQRLISNPNRPVQVIWAGKPYPMDYEAIALFDRIVNVTKAYSNCATLIGYELKLSRLLKQGADIWLNVPRITHEASGTSGMTAAMNGAVNVSIADGWFPEFVKDKINGFQIPTSGINMHEHEEDEADAKNLYDMLEKELIPLYYNNPVAWLSVVKNGMRDILPQFDSNRMAAEYYDYLYKDNQTNTPTLP